MKIALVVEETRPGESVGRTFQRAIRYLQAGVPMVVLVDPAERAVIVFRQSRPAELLKEGEELSGNEASPDFRCRVADFFALRAGLEREPRLA